MMITRNNIQPKKSKCKQWSLGILIALVVIYSVGWYFASEFVQNKLVQFLEHGQTKNSTITCSKINKSGYPLRVGVNCENFNFQQPVAGTVIKTKSLKATAPIYAPKWADITVSGPAIFNINGSKQIDANWEEFKLSGDIDRELPNRINLFSENIQVDTKDVANQDKQLFSAGLLRLNLDDIKSDLTLQLVFDKLQLPFTLPKSNTPLPALEGVIRFKINDAYSLYNDRPSNLDVIKERFRGHDGVIDHTEIALETGGKIKINGPFSVDDLGYLNADFDIAVSDINALSSSMKLIFPNDAKNIETILFVISSMPKNKQGEPVIKLSVKNGEAKLGYIKIGNIDPL